jgi:F0F1-type ATP synthase delta subunit
MANKLKNIVLIESRFNELEALSKELDQYGKVFLYTTLNLEKAFKHISTYDQNWNKIDLVVVDLDFDHDENSVLVKNSIDFIKKVKENFPYIKVVINSGKEKNVDHLQEMLEDLEPDAYYINLLENKNFFISVNKEKNFYREYAKNIYHTLLKNDKTYLTDLEKEILQALVEEEKLARLKGKFFMTDYSKKPLSINQLNKIISGLMDRFEVETKYQLIIKVYTLGLISHVEL